MNQPTETPTTTLVGRIVDDLDTIRGWWPELTADRIPGTRRRAVTGHQPHPQTHCPDCGWPIAWLVTTRQPYCTRPDHWKWPACSTAVALGHSPAAVRVDVLDDITIAEDQLVALATAIRHHLGDGTTRRRLKREPLGAQLAVSDTTPAVHPLPGVRVSRGHHTVWAPDEEPTVDWLRTRDRHMTIARQRAIGGYQPDTTAPALLAYLRTAITRITEPAELRAIQHAVRQILGPVRHAAAAGRRSARVPRECPICDRMTLVVLEGLYDPDTGRPREDTLQQRRNVLCTAEDCRCEDTTCGCHVGRRHRWDEDELERLGITISYGEERVRTSA